MSTGDFEEQLRETLCTRPSIEQAKGVLASLMHCTPDHAFDTICLASQHHNVSVSELALGLLDVAAERVPVDQGARAVIWIEWADLFPKLTLD